MKKWLFILVIILTLSAGCIYLSAPETEGTQGTVKGQLPTAYIDSITPATPSPGESITFSGHGTDPDGTIVGYKWRSSINGDLSNLASFQNSSLSSGTHSIYFGVQDNQGNWSLEASTTITISSTQATTLPIIKTFYADPGTILIGKPTTLSS